METTHYLSHYKINELFADYYSKEKNGITKYILRIDGKTIYEDKQDLTESDIKQMVYGSDIYKLAVKTDKPLVKI